MPNEKEISEEEKKKRERELNKLIAELRDIKGSGTELISIYIPDGYPLHEVTNKLNNEYSQAGNIKSKSTRKNVQGAIEKIINYLKIFKSTPKNGIAIFCGNISQDPSKTDIRLFSIVPPYPIQVQIYRCDSTFLLEPLEFLKGRKEKYGLIAISGDEATIGILEGNVAKVIKKIQSFGPKKTHKGGSSSARYQRFVEEKIEEFYKRVGDYMNEILLANGIKKIVIGGPGPAKEDFLKLKPFNYQFEVLGVVSIGYSDEYGIEVLKEKSFEIIGEKRTMYEKELVNKFLREVVKDGLAVYGIEETKKALEEGKVEILLLSENVSLKRVVFECENGHREEVFMEKDELNRIKKVFCDCGSEKKIIEEKDVFDEFFDLAESLGVKVEILSADTKEGAQFLGGFKGIGAILRFK